MSVVLWSVRYSNRMCESVIHSNFSDDRYMTDIAVIIAIVCIYNSYTSGDFERETKGKA